MRRLLTSILVVPLLLLAFSSAASGTSGTPKSGTKLFFDGTTAQGEEAFFIIEKQGTALYWEPFFTTSDISCPDGTSFTFEWFFINYMILLDAQKHFETSIISNQIPFDWQGTLVGKNASGTQNQGYASYATTGGVQDCGTGDIAWQASGIGSKPTSGSHTDYTVTVQRDQYGKVHMTITRN